MLTLTQNELMIVGKYFNTIQDYINITKTCKTYNQILKLYKTNFIPISTQQEFELFENIETYTVYTTKDLKIDDIKTISYKQTYLSEAEKNKDKDITYKHVILNYNLNVEHLSPNTNITSISYSCFKKCQTLKSIVLPYSITKIGKCCFRHCKNLKTVDLNMCKYLKEIPDYCFKNCDKLENVILPTGITRIGKYCFKNCDKLENINLDVYKNLVELGKSCFEHCVKFENIILPTSITKLGSGCFGRCYKLQYINIPSGIKKLGVSIYVKG